MTQDARKAGVNSRTSESKTLDEALAANDEAVRLELEAFEANIDEEIEQMRAALGPPLSEFVGPEYTRFIRRTDIHCRHLQESLRITGEALEKLKAKWDNPR